MRIKATTLCFITLCGSLVSPSSAQDVSRSQESASYVSGHRINLRMKGTAVGEDAIIPIYNGTIAAIEDDSVTLKDVVLTTRTYRPIPWLASIPQLSKLVRSVSVKSEPLAREVRIVRNEIFQQSSPSLSAKD